jgi:hypothetical protein
MDALPKYTDQTVAVLNHLVNKSYHMYNITKVHLIVKTKQQTRKTKSSYFIILMMSQEFHLIAKIQKF